MYKSMNCGEDLSSHDVFSCPHSLGYYRIAKTEDHRDWERVKISIEYASLAIVFQDADWRSADATWPTIQSPALNHE